MRKIGTQGHGDEDCKSLLLMPTRGPFSSFSAFVSGPGPGALPFSLATQLYRRGVHHGIPRLGFLAAAATVLIKTLSSSRARPSTVPSYQLDWSHQTQTYCLHQTNGLLCDLVFRCRPGSCSNLLCKHVEKLPMLLFPAGWRP